MNNEPAAENRGVRRVSGVAENRLGLLKPGTLTLSGTDIWAPPMTMVEPDGTHVGYEADIAEAIGEALGLEIEWVDFRKWEDFLGSVLDGRTDAVLMNQAITEERQAIVDFTIPYGLFDEAPLVRRDSGIARVEDLAGKKVGAIEGTTNIEVARGIEGAEIVPFGHGDNMFEVMLDTVRNGEVAALIDDELVLEGLGEKYPELEVPFTIPTANPYGIAVKPGADALLEALDGALRRLLEDGRLEEMWNRWFPGKPFDLDPKKV